MSNKSEATFHGAARQMTPDELEANGLPRDFHGAEPEAETVGDWAGTHTPIEEQIDAEPVDHDPQADEELLRWRRAQISEGIRDLVMISGENSRDHGFHDDWPVDVDLLNPGRDRDYQKSIVEKLALQHEEVSESLGEIRSGRDPLEIYFVDKKGLIGPAGAEYESQAYGDMEDDETVGAYIFDTPPPTWKPLLKPEGFLVEQADAIIRIADLAYLVNGRERLIEALEIKHEYNATRPYKHGRKF